MSRLIDADALRAQFPEPEDMRNPYKALVHITGIWAEIDNAPTIEPEIKPVDYRDCANAMLRMWMDNVITDGEYNRIMNKLNAFWEDEDNNDIH